MQRRENTHGENTYREETSHAQRQQRDFLLSRCAQQSDCSRHCENRDNRERQHTQRPTQRPHTQRQQTQRRDHTHKRHTETIAPTFMPVGVQTLQSSKIPTRCCLQVLSFPLLVFVLAGWLFSGFLFVCEVFVLGVQPMTQVALNLRHALERFFGVVCFCSQDICKTK